MAARLEEVPVAAPGPGANARGPARQKLTAPSLGAQFTRQLNSLMQKLHSTQPHFIKCIKPNTEKKGGLYVVDEARLGPLSHFPLPPTTTPAAPNSRRPAASACLHLPAIVFLRVSVFPP